MKGQKYKYPGDPAVVRLLAKRNCPTPFHVVRMRFLGEIASLELGASPVKVIESFWEGDLPVFDGEGEASAFFQTMLGLWNRMARHQGGVLVKLARPKKVRERADVAAVLRMRAAEIRDGFLAGYKGGGDKEGPLPEGLAKALHGLAEIADRFDEAAERVQGAGEGDKGLSLDDYRKLVEVRTKEVEALLTTLVGASTEIRRLRIAATQGFDQG